MSKGLLILIVGVILGLLSMPALIAYVFHTAQTISDPSPEHFQNLTAEGVNLAVDAATPWWLVLLQSPWSGIGVLIIVGVVIFAPALLKL